MYKPFIKAFRDDEDWLSRPDTLSILPVSVTAIVVVTNLEEITRMPDRIPARTPKGNPSPGNGDNDGDDGGDGNPPDPPPPAPQGADGQRHDDHRHATPTLDTQQPQPRQEGMRPGSKTALAVLITALIAAILAGGLGYLLAGGCAKTPDAPPPVVITAPAPPSAYDAALATPQDFRTNGMCGPLASAKTFFVGNATGTSDPPIGFICQPGGGTEFVLLSTSKGRVLQGNLIVSNSDKIESIFGNSMSYIGPNTKSGASTAFGAHPMSDYLPGKTHLMVRVDGNLIDLVNPLIVQMGENGGDTFDQICKPYQGMRSAPTETWEAEIWSRCRRNKTAANVATTTTLVRYIQANPGVSRDDFQTATAKIARLEAQVAEGGNKALPPSKVSTDVGK